MDASHATPASQGHRFAASTALVWGMLGASVCAFMVRFEPNLLEEGLIVHVAQRMVAGEHLYRDVVSFTGPLPFELLAALFRAFGEEIAVARGAVVLLHGLACASVYGVAARAGAGPLAHVAAAGMASAPVLLFPLFSLFFHTTLAFEFSVIAAYPALRACESDRWGWLAGILVACAALCKQTLGVALAAGLLAAVFACAPRNRRFRAPLQLAAGGVAVALVTLGAYALRGELQLLVHSIVVLPLSFDETFSTPYMNFWPPGVLAEDVVPNKALYFPSLYALTHGVFGDEPVWAVLLTQLLYALPFIALACPALARRRGPLPPAVWIHTAVLFALTTNLFPRSDWGHLVFALPPALAQIAMTWPARPGRVSRRRVRIAAGCSAALALGFVAATWAILARAREPQLGPHVPQNPVTGQVRGRSLSNAIAYLRQNLEPGDTIFVARSEPLIYFATDAHNPTPYSGVIPGMREEQERTILEALEDVRYVVMSDIDQDLYTWYREELPAVEAHLERFFRVPEDYPLARYNWISVLEPGPDRGATVIDLFDRSDQGHVWIRGRDGAERSVSEPLPRLATKLNRRPIAIPLGPRGGGIDFDLEIPENARFEAGIGITALVGEEDLFSQEERCQFSVAVSRGDAFETLGSVRLVKPGMRWKPFAVDLSAYAGEQITLRLALTPNKLLLDPEARALWGGPRITVSNPNE